jgi:hypothetical protein
MGLYDWAATSIRFPCPNSDSPHQGLSSILGRPKMSVQAGGSSFHACWRSLPSRQAEIQARASRSRATFSIRFVIHGGPKKTDQSEVCRGLREGGLAASDPDRPWHHRLADRGHHAFLRTERKTVAVCRRESHGQRKGLSAWPIKRFGHRKDQGPLRSEVKSLREPGFRPQLYSGLRKTFPMQMGRSRVIFNHQDSHECFLDSTNPIRFSFWAGSRDCRT